MDMAGMLLAETDEIARIAREKRQIKKRLIGAAGCEDFAPMLRLCGRLSGMIDEVSGMISKKEKYAHASFMPKIKFSRKFYHKGKDLLNFEAEIASEFESGRISMELGRKMVAALKLLKSENAGKAREEAAEAYSLLEMGGRLDVINEALSKKKLQAERAKRDIEEQLSNLEWLEKEPPPDHEKIGRHEEGLRQLEGLQKIRQRRISALESMPLAQVLDEIRMEKPPGVGFPEITEADSWSLKSFLQKGGLESKTAAQLLEIAGRNEERLRHEISDLPGLRREIIGRRAFIFELSSLNSREFLKLNGYRSPALAYLCRNYEEARNAARSLSELEKTAEEDAREWERRQKIECVRAALEGVEQAALDKSLKELEKLRNILDGAENPEAHEPSPKKAGLWDSIMGIFR